MFQTKHDKTSFEGNPKNMGRARKLLVFTGEMQDFTSTGRDLNSQGAYEHVNGFNGGMMRKNHENSTKILTAKISKFAASCGHFGSHSCARSGFWRFRNSCTACNSLGSWVHFRNLPGKDVTRTSLDMMVNLYLISLG